MRPLLAVSSCLLGQAVRYDGSDKHQVWLTHELAKQVDFQPLCPEMAIGLGVPRPAIHLCEQDGQIRLLGVMNPSDDFTLRMQQHALAMVEQLRDISGYIFKSKSPSCGIDNVKLIDSQGQLSRKGVGVYSELIRQHLPDVPIIDEQGLKNKSARTRFLQQVFEHAGMLRR